MPSYAQSELLDYLSKNPHASSLETWTDLGWPDTVTLQMLAKLYREGVIQGHGPKAHHERTWTVV